MNEKIVSLLNEILVRELTAARHYMAMHCQCEVWGFEILDEYYKKESHEETHHAEDIAEHILSMGGKPEFMMTNMVELQPDVPKQLYKTLEIENEMIDFLKTCMSTCIAEGDFVTHDMLHKLLMKEDESVEWVETQISILEKIGEQNYLAKQVKV